MEDPEIKARIARRLWRDGIHPDRFADIDTVADLSVADSEGGRAKELCEEMADDTESPILWGIAGQAIAVERDEQSVAQFIKDHGGEELLPWDLRETLNDSEDD